MILASIQAPRVWILADSVASLNIAWDSQDSYKTKTDFVPNVLVSGPSYVPQTVVSVLPDRV